MKEIRIKSFFSLLLLLVMPLFAFEQASAQGGGDAEIKRHKRQLEERYKDFWRVIEGRRERQVERLEAGDRQRSVRETEEERREKIRREHVAQRDSRPPADEKRERLRLQWEKEQEKIEQQREKNRIQYARRQEAFRQLREEHYKIPEKLELSLELDVEDLRE